MSASAADTRTPEEKARAKRTHAQVMLVIGCFTAACGLAAAYLAFSRAGRLPRLLSLRSDAGVPAASLSLPAGPHAAPQLISWKTWGAPAFDEAGKSGRLVLLDMCPAWSHECHVMDETTYARPEAAQWVAANVIAVRADPEVDAEAAFRFPNPIWPLTALLLPSGEMLSSGSLIGPDQFLPWAQQIRAAYRNNPSSIAQAAAAARDAAEKSRKALLADAAGSSGDAVADAFQRVSSQADAVRGGIGPGWKLLLPDIDRFLAEYARRQPDGAALPLLSAMLAADRNLEDPAWGGFYRASSAPDWKRPEFEKPLSTQAEAIRAFSEAYALSHDASFQSAAERTAAFIDRFLRLPDGAYSVGIDADLHLPDGGWVAGSDYYRKPEAERLKLGLPAKEEAAPVQSNADLAEALLVAGSALRQDALVRRGTALLDVIWSRAVRPDGSVARRIPQGAKRDAVVPGGLADAVAVARAELAAAAVTQDPRHLQRAVRVALSAAQRFKDASGALRAYDAVRGQSAGTWFSPLDPDDTAELAAAFPGSVLNRLHPDDRRIVEGIASWVDAHRAAVDPVRYARAEMAKGL